MCRYLKVFIKKKTIFVIIASSIISNIHVRHTERQYEDFYQNAESRIEFVGVIVSEPTKREHNYRYIIRGVAGKYSNKRFLLYVRKDGKCLLEYGDLIKLSRGTRNSEYKKKL